MAIKKSQLYGSLWKSCNELRGGMDASQYKDYILTLLFVKYVTDKQKADPHSLIEVPDGGSFDDMLALKGDKEIGDKINKIIGRLAQANGLEKVIDLADFNDEEKLGRGKEMQDRLTQLVAIFADLDFRGSRAEGDDLLGDAYEYLMRHFATESGKSKGQFYTPAEVSRVLAKVVGIGATTRQDQTVYDPTCGSGSLLLKVANEAPRGVTIYGQEKDNATWALSKMNMILHGHADADIRKGDTITGPEFTDAGELRTFDFAVANPPFSVKSWSNGLELEYGRFGYGRPPAKNGDYAFLLHVLKSLKSTGKAAVILPHGVLFRGHGEAAIRRRLLRQGFIKGIIGLPANLFYGTGIPACIVVLDKAEAQARAQAGSGVFMINASMGFVKDGNKNRLRSQDIHKIVDVFTKQTEIPRYSRMVPLAEIADPKNDYNLNLPRYVDSSEPEDLQDLRAHLHGGIPARDVEALADYWDAFPHLHAMLFKDGTRPGYCELAVDVSKVHQTILESTEFKAFQVKALGLVNGWFEAHRSTLEAIDADTVPNDLIAEIGDDLLARFKGLPLVDPYDEYEQLMTYWHGTIHDDVFLVMNEGWHAAARPRPTILDKDGKLSETPDLVIGSRRSAAKYKTDLLPPSLIVARYFAEQRADVEDLHAVAEEASRLVKEYLEEHAVEEGLLSEAMEGDQVSKTLAQARLKEAKREGTDPDEVAALEHVVGLYNDESAAKRAAKDTQTELDVVTLKQYGELSDRDVKSLLLTDKWSATIAAGIAAEVESLTFGLVGRILQLGERYAETVEELDVELSTIASRVASHLDLLVGRTRLPGFTSPWRTFRLEELGSFLKGRGIKRDDVQRTGIACIRYGELYTTYSGYTDVTVSYVAPNVAATALPLRQGDLLFAASGETRAEIGTCVAFTGAQRAVAGGDIVVLRAPAVNPIYLATLVNTPAVVNRKARLGQGDAVVHISSRALGSIEVQLPSREEQDAIAGVLVDADREIQRLKARLAKVNDLKAGMVQQLIGAPSRADIAEGS